MAGIVPSDDDLGGTTPSRLADIWSLGKPRLSSFVIFTAGGGMFLAEGTASKATILAGLLGTTMVVASANSLNNYIERDSDTKMARTRDRPLPARRMRPWVALVYGFLLMAIAIPWMYKETTILATGLAIFAWFTYVCVYTPLKRRSWLSVLVGGISGAIPPLIGWTAINDTEFVGGIALFAILFLWQLPHSLAITMYRKSEYAAAGLKILPIEKSDAVTRRHILAYVIGLVAVSIWIAQMDFGGPLTMAGAIALGGVFLWKAWQGLRHEGGDAWARDLFLYSLVYLSGLFVVMAVDHVL